MTLSTHILDLNSGQPAAGITVTLYYGISEIAVYTTDADGRCQDMLPKDFDAGVYRLEFSVGPYFKQKREESFYDIIPVVFNISDTKRHYHVPLLLSPFGYSTYRGS